MMERPATWKILTLGIALTGLAGAGAGMAFADESAAGPVDVRPIAVTSAPATDDAAPLAPLPGDLSPESVDSPFESPADSADSPFDSPDDDRYDGPDGTFASPVDTTADSPADVTADVTADSPDQADDTP